MDTARHLHVVDHNGEATPQCAQCLALLRNLDRQEGIIATKQREIDELRHTKKDLLSTTELAGDIMDVLKFHKRILSPSAKIHRGGPAWKNVKDRFEDTDAETGFLSFTKKDLLGAVVGLWTVDSEDGWYRKHGKIGAKFLFGSADRVEEFLDPVRALDRKIGTSALEIVDELMGEGLAWLAVRCECGHLRLDHERERPELGTVQPPCAVHGCACTGFDDFTWRSERWLALRHDRVRDAHA